MLRVVQTVPFLVALAAFLFPVAARAACYQPGNSYPPVQGSTHIESISPQVALAGITPVYIQGYCFGDTQGTGGITLNGEVVPATNIVFWTDAEIEFIPPLDSQSGDLVVTSSSYGSDSSADEANCPGNYINGENWDYCGNGEIHSPFTISTANAPSYWLPPNSQGCNSSQPCLLSAGTRTAPQYVQGTWYYDAGTQTMTLYLDSGTAKRRRHLADNRHRGNELGSRVSVPGVWNTRPVWRVRSFAPLGRRQ